MNTGYKRLICTLCAASAALCMTVAPAGAESCSVRNADGYGLCAERSVERTAPTAFAEDGGEKKKDNSKSTLKEQTKSSWQIYACIGGGALAVVAVISLLAEEMKKK